MTDKKKKVNYKKIIKTLSSNYWAVSAIVLAILLIAVLISGGISGATVSADTVGQNVLDFANNQGANAELVSVNNNEGLYEVVLSIDGQEVPVYVTKDGKNLIPSLIPLTANVVQETPTQQAPAPTEVTKSDKPTVELFVMTHCPYGTQAEKGFVPLLESFNEADAKIRFVHYFMHEPEKTETPRQVCIREEQADKFLPYLREFLKEGDSEAALTAANIDTVKMETCISSGKWEEYYNEDKALSQKYDAEIKKAGGNGIGSPLFVVNGVIVQSGRDSASYLQTVCSAFNNAPAECETLELSNSAPSPMWGWDESGSNTAAQC